MIYQNTGTMEAKLVIFAGILSVILAISHVSAQPIADDRIPDETGLFFGKRRHMNPNVNNLLFGRRSSSLLSPDDVKHVCKSVISTCVNWFDALSEPKEQQPQA